MARIPELPSTYRVGDVVNGHMLDERGNWVPTAHRDTRTTQASTVTGVAEGRHATRVAGDGVSWQRESGTGQTSAVSDSRAPGARKRSGCGVFVLIAVAVFAVPALRAVGDQIAAFDDGPRFDVAVPDWELDQGEPVLGEVDDSGVGGTTEPHDLELIDAATWVDGEFVSSFVLIEASDMGADADEVLHFFELQVRNADGDLVASSYRSAVTEPGEHYAFTWTSGLEAEPVEPLSIDVVLDAAYEPEDDTVVAERWAQDLTAEGNVVEGTLLLDAQETQPYPSVILVIRDDNGAVLDAAHLQAIDPITPGADTEAAARARFGQLPAGFTIDASAIEIYYPN